MDRSRILDQLMQSTREGYWLIDPEGITLDLNPAMCAILARPHDAVMGTSIFDYVDSENRAIFAHQIELRARGIIGPYEVALLRPDGTSIACVNNATPVVDENGILLGSVGLWTDISDIKEVQRQLADAKEEAEAANRAKSAFLAAMSHEIRTPLNGVLGAADLLLMRKLADDEASLVETIVRSGRGLLDIISDILDFSKIEAGKLDLDCAPLSLRELVEDALETLAPVAHAKRVELAAVVPGAVEDGLLGDRTRLRQVLLNLIGNAVKFTSKGYVVLRVSQETDRAQPAVRLTVEDTGVGIAPEACERIFSPFVQGDSTTTRDYGGTGLGLTIARHLVQAMGGQIEVESRLGQGSVFSVELPVTATGKAISRGVGATYADVDAVLAMAPGIHADALSANLEYLGVRFREVRSPRALESALNAGTTGRTPGRTVVFIEPSFIPAPALATLRAGAPNAFWAALTTAQTYDSTPSLEWADAALSKPVLFSSLLSLLAERRTNPHSDIPPPHASSAPAREPVRVLVAEDDEINQFVVGEMLDILGCDVTPAWNGEEAVEAHQRTDFDIILMDIHMPHMDGYDATRSIRRHELDAPESRTPIVALTANALTSDRQICFEAGMDDFLSKPITIDHLADLLTRWCGYEARVPS